MFPNTPLDVHIDLDISGVWEDITSYRMERDPITITQGRSGSGYSADPSRCTLTLNNRDGRFSPRNPRGPWFGQIGRNTPLRVWVPGSESFYDQGGWQSDWLRTPSSNALDIASDLDVRFDMALDEMAPIVGGDAKFQEIGGRYEVSTDTRSWRVLLTDSGGVEFYWSETGTDVRQVVAAETLKQSAGQRFTLRVTLDVDNGAGQHVVTFYTGNSLSGPWSPLAEHVLGGTTSINNPVDGLGIRVGALNLTDFEPAAGRYYGFELRDGIDGSVLADLPISDLPTGAEAFEDSAGNIWQVDGGEIHNRNYRFHGEVSEWPQAWDITGTDVSASITASGVTRRLRQGNKAQPSALRRALTESNAIAYWPMEEPKGATAAFSPMPNVQGLKADGITFGEVDDLTGSLPLPKVTGNALLHGYTPSGWQAGEGYPGWTFSMVYKLDTLPETRQWFMKILVSSPKYKFVQVDVGKDDWRIWAENEDGDVVANFSQPWNPSLTPFDGQWNRFAMWDHPEGLSFAWQNDSTGNWASYFANLVNPFGAINAFRANWGPDMADQLSIGHIAAFNGGGSSSAPDPSPYDNAMSGYPGEFAAYRMYRVSEETGVDFVSSSPVSSTELMGGQSPTTYLDTMEACATVDGGLLYESVDRAGLFYRSRDSLYGQPARLTLDYAGGRREVAPPLTPVDDDSEIRNDVTVQREGGSSSRYRETNGALSALPPPDGVGTYDESVTVNAFHDDQLPDIAGWLVHRGTVDESRYPSLSVRLHAAPHLIEDVLRFRLLDRLQVVNPPEWLPPEPIDQVATGYTETMSMFAWEIEYACQPYAPFKVGEVSGDDSYDGDFGTVDTEHTTLSQSVDEDVETLVVSADDTPGWVTRGRVITANRGFEQNMDSWSQWGASESRVPTPQPAPFGGQWSLQVSPDGVTGGANTYTSQVPVTEGIEYEGVAWVRCATSRSVDLLYNWYSTGGAFISQSIVSQDVEAGTWTYFALSDSAPVGAGLANMSVRLPGSSSADDVFLVDMAYMREVVSGEYASDFPFDVRVGHAEVMTVLSAQPHVEVDTFNRTVADGWGQRTSGETWIRSDYYGTASVYTDGSSGLIQLDAPGDSVILMSAGPSAYREDSDASVTASLPSFSGTFAAAGLVARQYDDWSFYAGIVEAHPDGSVSLAVFHSDGMRGRTLLGSLSGTYEFGTGIRMRLLTEGDRLRFKVWTEGTEEPGGWHIDVNDDRIPMGTSGVFTDLSEVTSPTPYAAAYMDYSLDAGDAQEFQVVRGMGGLRFSHTAGADVRLANPAIAAF